MLQTVVTALAGIAIGIVAGRLWLNYSASRARNGGEDQSAGTGRMAGAATDARAPAPAIKSGLSSVLTTSRMLAAAGVVILAALGVKVFGDSSDSDNGSSGVALAGAPPGSQQQLDDVDTMIGRLAMRLKENPDDGEGFRMLGWSYVMTNRPQEAIVHYKRALELLPDSALVHSGYGEALVKISGDIVTPEAKAEFAKALSLDASEPRAKYFLALRDAQNGRKQEALESWIELSNGGPADAPWQSEVQRKIAEVSKDIGANVNGRLKPMAAAGKPPSLDPAKLDAAQSMSPTERQSMIDGMVEGLAKKLKSDPGDAEGWSRLIRSRMVLGQKEKAGQDLVIARSALARDKAGLAKVNTLAKEVGVPGA